ncbi:endo-1,3-beta-glucanase [Kineosporia sp. NBRC 101677]|uniref:carbohydrate-binding protein n=1 Tax=Kineosporia sp. NBRC 101677 TaxID=3032197 RepID=UPI0024A00A67|nr:carbohydrate-binding protein [Kineosporia sp. NBRC 101677]GLY13988.1 endo-1,3-beta-glucanase [Kineosporia sp. NBRC 101677]
MSQQRLSRARRTAVVASGAVALAVATAVAVASPGNSAPAPEGFTTVWQDDFDGAAGASPSGDNWLFDIGHSYPGGAANWGTGEIAAHTDRPENVSLDGNGNLNITPLRDGSGNWTSARIETQRSDFAAPEGGVVRFESRIKLPDVSGAAAQGIWPAFWSLGEPFRGVYTNWPGTGEIDVMENVNGENTVHGTIHCGTAPGGECNENTGLGNSRSGFSPSLQADFHTYSVELDRSTSPEQLRWYVDGQNYHTVKSDQVSAETWAKATDHGFFLILNVAVGGGWPGMPTASTASGKPMIVDYVSVSQKGGDAGEGTQPSEPVATTEPVSTEPVSTEPGTPTEPVEPGESVEPGTGGGRDAFGAIEAESFDSQSGIKTVNGGSALGSIANGDSAVFKGVRFGDRPARTFVAKVASGADPGVSGLVEVRLDSATAEPAATFSVASTGGWNKFRDIPGEMRPTTGTHDVYLTFKSGSPAEFVDLDSFTFAR